MNGHRDIRGAHATACATAGAGSRAATRLTVVALLVVVALAVPATAFGQTFTDVPGTQWAHDQISWVTNQGPDAKKLLDDYEGGLFKPNADLTRAQLARALVVASGHQDDVVEPPDIPDVKPDHPYFHDIAVALKLGLMEQYPDGFHPDGTIKSWQVDRAVVRMIRLTHAADDWAMLHALNPRVWEPNAGWKTGAPAYFPWEVAARYLGLRFNHPSDKDGQEVSPNQRLPRDETAYVFYQALHVPDWRVDGLATYNAVALPKLTKRQKAIVAFAAKYIGYPYVWGGEYPTKDSPYGAQAHGGFDCSGFDWWVLKMHFGYTINERVAADMARAAKPRITRAKLVPGDMIFFGPNGPKSTAASVYHAALYLGKGWFIHSTGSSDGVSLASINWAGWSWKTDFAWGRRVLKAGQFIAPTLAASAADLAPPAFTPAAFDAAAIRAATIGQDAPSTPGP